MSQDQRARLAAKVKTTHYLGDGPKKSVDIRYHTVTAECVNAQERLSKGQIKVSCSCEDYWSTWEVALKKQGAADIRYSNGKTPRVKNPAMIPGCCKHLFRFLQNILVYKL